MSQHYNIEQFERIDRNEKLFQKQIQELFNRLTRIENIVYQDNNPFNENSESQKVEGLNKANGGTPGEVNPVGQIEIKLLNKLNRMLELTNSFNIDEKTILKEIIDNLINKPRETDKEEPKKIWKLHCKNKDNNYKAKLEIFKGTALELALFVEKVNNKNYSYYIVDFEEIGL